MNLDRVIAVRNNKTIYRDGDRCVKVFNAEYSKADVLNEALNQARIEETGLNIPKVLEVTMIDGKWAIVSEFIKGKTLAQLIKEAEDDADKKAQYIELLVELQMSVHAKTCPLLNRIKDRMNMKISQCDLDATTRFDLHARLERMPKQSVICHGDFRPSNIIIPEDGEPFILDWSHATQGDPAADAAQTYLRFWLNGDITGARIYLDTFCEKSGIDKQHIYSWMPIVAAARSVDGNNVKEREFLLSWVNTVYEE